MRSKHGVRFSPRRGDNGRKQFRLRQDAMMLRAAGSAFRRIESRSIQGWDRLEGRTRAGSDAVLSHHDRPAKTLQRASGLSDATVTFVVPVPSAYASSRAIRQVLATCYAGGPSVSIDIYPIHKVTRGGGEVSVSNSGRVFGRTPTYGRPRTLRRRRLPQAYGQKLASASISAWGCSPRSHHVRRASPAT